MGAEAHFLGWKHSVANLTKGNLAVVTVRLRAELGISVEMKLGATHDTDRFCDHRAIYVRAASDLEVRIWSIHGYIRLRSA